MASPSSRPRCLDWAPMGLLQEKCALVTGGTTGLGLAIAGRFLHEGAQVVITGRDHDLGERAVQALGPGASFVAADAADPGAAASSVTAAVAIWAAWTCW